MISFRLPWYSLLGGGLVTLLVCIVPINEPARLSIALAGIVLLLDGALGLRVLPSLTPFASFPEDWREIERNLYQRKVGIVRLTVVGLICIGFALGAAIIGAGDWQVWYMVATIIGWGTAWYFAALRAIHDALANDS